MSTRPDVVERRISRRIVSLQDNVPADPPEVIHRTIEYELGRPLAELFCEFDPFPLLGVDGASISSLE